MTTTAGVPVTMATVAAYGDGILQTVGDVAGVAGV